MPLTRPNVSIVARVLLPLLPLFSAVVGLSFLGTPKARLLATPGLRYAERLGVLEVWGVGFLVVAMIMIIALLAHHRHLYAAGLAILGVWLALWSLLLVASAWFGESSWSAWSWPALIAAMCWGLLLSLLSGEA